MNVRDQRSAARLETPAWGWALCALLIAVVLSAGDGARFPRRSRVHHSLTTPALTALPLGVGGGGNDSANAKSLAGGAARRSALGRARVAAVVQPRQLSTVAVAQIGGLYGP